MDAKKMANVIKWLLSAAVLTYAKQNSTNGQIITRTPNNSDVAGAGVNEKIVFPSRNKTYTPQCVVGTNCFLNIANYPPEEEIDSLLHDLPSKFSAYMYSDSATGRSIPASSSAGYRPSCESVVQYIKIRSAPLSHSEDKVLMMIVNTAKHEQIVRVEMCSKEASCGPFSIYITDCRQEYTQRKLLALEADGRATMRSFDIPSTCVCYHRLQN